MVNYAAGAVAVDRQPKSQNLQFHSLTKSGTHVLLHTKRRYFAKRKKVSTSRQLALSFRDQSLSFCG